MRILNVEDDNRVEKSGNPPQKFDFHAIQN